MIQTWLTETFGLTVPVIGAPMAGPSEGALAAAVSRGGGLGMIGVNASRTPAWIAEQAAVARAGGRFGIGLMAWALEANPDQLDAVIAARPELVSVSFGAFEPHVAALKRAGITVTTQAGTLDEAVRAQRAGVDLVVARGAEAGGHGRNAVGTLSLLQTVLAAVDLPVVAAGGIGTPRGLAAVLAAGAVGAWVGTAFLGCPEAASTPAARQRLFAATETSYGRVFDVAQHLPWPAEYGGRAVRNRFFTTWEARLEELGRDADASRELERARAEEDYDTAYLYAGQGVTLLERERPAAEVLADLAGAEQLLAGAAGLSQRPAGRG